MNPEGIFALALLLLAARAKPVDPRKMVAVRTTVNSRALRVAGRGVGREIRQDFGVDVVFVQVAAGAVFDLAGRGGRARRRSEAGVRDEEHATAVR